MHRVILLLFFLILNQVPKLSAQENQAIEEALIESFLSDLAVIDSISNAFVNKYTVFANRKAEQKVKNGLSELKRKYIKYIQHKPAQIDVKDVHFKSDQGLFRYFGIQLDNDHSLNFVVKTKKIKSISLYTESSYDTLIFF